MLEMKHGNMKTSSTLSMEEERMAARENRFELLKLLSESGALDRDILVMKLIQGNSNKEIAVHLGLAEYTVKIRIQDALKK